MVSFIDTHRDEYGVEPTSGCLWMTSCDVLKERPMESPVLSHFLTPQLKSKPVNTSAFILAVRETNTTVLDVALEVGYEDPSYFSRAFKRTAGISPSEYRHQQLLHKNGPAQQ